MRFCRGGYLNNNVHFARQSKEQPQDNPRSIPRRCAGNFFNIFGTTWLRPILRGFAFIKPYQFNSPTDDLSQWDDIMEQINNTMERTSKRPYYIQVEFGDGEEDPRFVSTGCNPHSGGFIANYSSHPFKRGRVLHQSSLLALH